ncbi:DNA repair protein RecN [Algicola sagamiensis]|uniref:DNA repair protein RecN n=1 Tax=Algicola sagamiensis TaxID=163869 RepID=UPI0003A51BFF|nr:DNA repair protein RecN [Algicola sagamiensis]
MLTHLQISNFAIVEHLDLSWHQGLSTITGETGAGKSIAIDALLLCLGERADSQSIRAGHARAEVTASFDIQHHPIAKTWLQAHDLDIENECTLRRVILKQGTSRAYINGTKVPVQQLKQLAQYLVSVHGQHAHQALLKPEYQRDLLDASFESELPRQKTHDVYHCLQTLHKKHDALQQAREQRENKRQLAQYQVSELDEYAPIEGEFASIEQEHKILSHGQELRTQTHQLLNRLYDADQHAIFGQIQHVCAAIAEMSEVDEQLEKISTLLHEAMVNIEEASGDLRHYMNDIPVDPDKLYHLEQRLSQGIALARKHQVKPEDLSIRQQQLHQTLTALHQDDEQMQSLEQAIQNTQQDYLHAAQTLSQARQEAAGLLSARIQQSLAELCMPDCQFEIRVVCDEFQSPSPNGLDQIEFWVSTNPGQPAQPMGKVASGGELSRISLAIQVILAGRIACPTIIFDEVDVGISGPTASAVGQKLQQLGGSTQVICVTHLPQVACQGHAQYLVKKTTDGDATTSTMLYLDKAGRIAELARLLSGSQTSLKAIENAKELLTI